MAWEHRTGVKMTAPKFPRDSTSYGGAVEPTGTTQD